MTRSSWITNRRRYRRYKARVHQLPATSHDAVEALERYLGVFGPGTANTVLEVLEDLVDRFEQAATQGQAVRDVVGDDPVAFAEELLAEHPQGQWIRRERDRLVDAIDGAARPDPTNRPRTRQHTHGGAA